MTNYNGAVLINLSTLRSLVKMGYEAGNSGWAELSESVSDTIVNEYVDKLKVVEEKASKKK